MIRTLMFYSDLTSMGCGAPLIVHPHPLGYKSCGQQQIRHWETLQYKLSFFPWALFMFWGWNKVLILKLPDALLLTWDFDFALMNTFQILLLEVFNMHFVNWIANQMRLNMPFTLGGLCTWHVYFGHFITNIEQVEIPYQLVQPMPLAQVLSHPQLIIPPKTWDFGIYLNFQRAEIT
jgi:hypothetical protein